MVTESRKELCGYSVVETLAEDATYLAIGPGGRGITLKKLDPDCLYGGLLHPDVRDRLSRVRELANRGVANLIGVGKEADDAWLIWEYIEGQTFTDYAQEHSRSSREFALLVRELVLTVDSLHAQGLVHGSLQSGNIVVKPEGSIHLTHISPLLYSDLTDDFEAIQETVAHAGKQCEKEAEAVVNLMKEHAATPLRTLASKLAILADDVELADLSDKTAVRCERRTRRRAIFGALVVLLAGVAAAYGVWRSAGSPGSERLPSWLK